MNSLQNTTEQISIPQYPGVKIDRVDLQDVCPIEHDPNKEVVYKQRWDGLWVGNNGTFLFSEEKYYNVRLVADGAIIKVIPFESTMQYHLKDYLGVKSVKLVYHSARYGREMRQLVKFNAGHMTPGTKFLCADIVGKDFKDKALTVKHLQFNGPGSILIVCEEKYPDSSLVFRRENFKVNVGHVTEIVSRVPGVPVFEYSEYEERRYEQDRELLNHALLQAKCRYSDIVFQSAVERAERLSNKGYIAYNECNALTAIFARMPELRNNRHEFYLDYDKITKLLQARGLFIGVKLLNKEGYQLRLRYVDPKKVIKLFRKNPALFCHNYRTIQKEQEERDRRYFEENDDYADLID